MEYFPVDNFSQFWVWFKIHCTKSSWLATTASVLCFLFLTHSKTHIHSTFHTSDFKWKTVIRRLTLKPDFLDLVELVLKATTSIDVYVLTIWKYTLIQGSYSICIYGHAVVHWVLWRYHCEQARAHIPLVWVIPCSTQKIHAVHWAKVISEDSRR